MLTTSNAASRAKARNLREPSCDWAKRCATLPDTLRKREITADCRAERPAGTRLAILDVPIGCAPFSVSPPFFRHGGARNSASRTSQWLTLAQAEKLMSAAHIAEQIGRPLNRHICVHWEAAGLTDREAMAATTAFLKYLREWCRGETAYLWTRENGAGKGSHVHILAHIPEGRTMKGALSRRWVARCTMRTYRAGAIFTRKIAGSSQAWGAHYGHDLSKVLAYTLKGTEPKSAQALGIGHENGGQITGKRCGTSRNLAGPRE